MKKNKNQLELADIFRKYGDDYRHNNFLSIEQSKSMYHIEICRTAVLGGHAEACDHCGFTKNAYNSCRDRHCPKCQTLVKEKWLDARKSELLPCPYFHKLINPEVKITVKLSETVQEMMMRLTGVDPSLCPECGIGKMVYIEELPNLLRDTS